MPFQSQSCQFSIPLTDVTTCDLLSGTASIDGGPPAPVIELGESLDSLPASQQTALLQASQSALNRLPATFVLPGERYDTTDGPRVATTTFQATLTFQLQSALGSGCSMDVFGAGGSGTCQLEPGENCERFCSPPFPSQQAARAASGATGWLVLAVVSLSWSYRTRDGGLLAHNQPLDVGGNAALNNHLVMLSILWNKAGWQVTPLLGDQVGGTLQASGGDPVGDDPGCAQAQDLLYNLTFEEPGGPPSATIHLADGSNPSSGCLVAAGSAVYLVRLGMVLPANQAADHPRKLRPALSLPPHRQREAAGSGAASFPRPECQHDVGRLLTPDQLLGLPPLHDKGGHGSEESPFGVTVLEVGEPGLDRIRGDLILRDRETRGLPQRMHLLS